MATFIPPPNVDELVPPFVEHLPASLTSSLPPPSLYPFLCYVLRQRVRLLSPTSPSESWVSLLAWSASEGQALRSHMQAQNFIPHPSSGTLEIGQPQLHGIQRVDAETLKASVSLSDLGLEIVYTWVTNDPDGEDDGWMVLDVHLLSTLERSSWFMSVTEAEDAFQAEESRKKNERTRPQASLGRSFGTMDNGAEVEVDDDDDYWNMYDHTPAHTPDPKKETDVSEDDYYSRYSEVEPALDNGRTEENTIVEALPTNALHSSSNSVSSQSDTTTSTPITTFSCHPAHAPRPISTDLQTSNQIKALEESATTFHNELIAKQHISTSVKSLYRLSRGIGISREDFTAALQREIELLPMLDEED